MFRIHLQKPEITHQDIRLAEGFRSPFWVDDIDPENDPEIEAAVAYFSRLRDELSSTRLQLAIYGAFGYIMWLLLMLLISATSIPNGLWNRAIGLLAFGCLVLAIGEGWIIFRLILKKDRAVDAVAQESMKRYDSWLDSLRDTDPDEYIRVSTWETDIRPALARIKLNEYF